MLETGCGYSLIHQLVTQRPLLEFSEPYRKLINKCYKGYIGGGGTSFKRVAVFVDRSANTFIAAFRLLS